MQPSMAVWLDTIRRVARKEEEEEEEEVHQVCEIIKKITIRNLSVLSMKVENMRSAMLYVKSQ